MSSVRVSLLLLLLASFSLAVIGCDDDSPTTPFPIEQFMAEDYFPLGAGLEHHFTNYVDGELTSTETWTVLAAESYQGRQAYQVLFTLLDLDDVELGRDTTWFAFDADSVLAYNEDAGEWEQDPFLSGWCEVDPPATHEFTRVHTEQGGLTIDYVAGFEGDEFEYTVGSTTYTNCRKITEDATVVGQDHTASGVRYYALGIGLVYSDLTDTFQFGGSDITLHREKIRVE